LSTPSTISRVAFWQAHHFVETLVLQGVEGADELDLVAHPLRIEEVQGGEKLEQPVVGFGQQCRHQYAATLMHVIEADLVGQDGLAGAWAALNDIGRARDQASLQQDVQASDASPKAF
jgi:hypothetical protein